MTKSAQMALPVKDSMYIYLYSNRRQLWQVYACIIKDGRDFYNNIVSLNHIIAGIQILCNDIVNMPNLQFYLFIL